MGGRIPRRNPPAADGRVPATVGNDPAVNGRADSTLDADPGGSPPAAWWVCDPVVDVRVYDTWPMFTEASNLVSLWGNALALALSAAGSRAKPSGKGAWVNYDAGVSEGRGNGGLYYTATGKQSWSHDEVYAQNPALEKVVGTRQEPTSHVFDCTQGNLDRDGESGEATGERQMRYGRNEAQREVHKIYSEIGVQEVRHTGV